ncbi:MAG: aminotransferase class V-fold PLP-dependent enzyme, partial [Phycisphaerales bacterium]|nr:aminotransferase class V-fold PLP-dependent enzyme [Phycisphaerales bacterium]
MDNNATTQPCPEVVEAIAAALRDSWGNPSSLHHAGQAARVAIERARQQVATLIGAKPFHLIFTGSGVESIDLAIRGTAQRSRPGTTPSPTVVTSSVEHPGVKSAIDSLASRGEITPVSVPVDSTGVIQFDPLHAALAAPIRPAIVSIQWANNETGVIQPVRRIGELCRARKVTFHCDATQWVGKEPVRDLESWCDLLNFSPHKFHGPKGVSVLWVRPGVRVSPVIHGSQERGARGGTENVPG